jgi:protein-disulfide isomerase
MKALLALALASLALAQSPAPAPKKSFLDKPTMEAYIRHLYVWPKQITVAISDPVPSPIDGLLSVTVTGSMGAARQTQQFYVSKSGEQVIQGTVFNAAHNPFKKDLDLLKTDLQPGYGTPGASVVVVIFSDFQCPYCKQEAKMIRDNLTTAFSKEVRVYFKDFPLEQIHNWAKPASIAGRCVYRQNTDKFWNFHDWMFANQELTTLENLRAKLEGFAVENKLDVPDFLKCFDTKATEAEVTKNFAEGRALEINSTPTVFVNGRRLAGSVSWDQLKQIIEFEIEYQKTAKNAGENCGCELKLPSPLNQ